MKSINKKIIQSQSGSAILGIIIFLLLCSSLFAWYLFTQTNNDLEKTKKQKERIQQRFTQKSDELYDSWDKLQKIQNKQNQLSQQFDQGKSKIKKLTNQLQLQSEKEQQSIQKLLLCTNKNTDYKSQLHKNKNENKELAKNIKQLITLNESKKNEIQKKHLLSISSEIKKHNECKSSLKLALVNTKKQEQQIVHSQNLLHTRLINTEELQRKIDSVNDDLDSHKKLLVTATADLGKLKGLLKEQLIKNQEIEKSYNNEYKNINQLLKNKVEIATGLTKKLEHASAKNIVMANKIEQLLKNKAEITTELTKKLEHASAKNIEMANKIEQLVIEHETLQNYNKKLEDELKKVPLDKKSSMNKPKLSKEEIKNEGRVNQEDCKPKCGAAL
jgi:hypothetical protein